MNKVVYLLHQGTCTSQECANLIKNKFFPWHLRMPKYQSTFFFYKNINLKQRRSKDIKRMTNDLDEGKHTDGSLR